MWPDPLLKPFPEVPQSKIKPVAPLFSPQPSLQPDPPLFIRFVKRVLLFLKQPEAETRFVLFFQPRFVSSFLMPF
jgi:hypothetical protein